jgi:cation transport protein ChaC
LARGTVRAVTFVADTAHGHFAGRLDVEETARLVAQGHGQRGRNIEYLANTVAHMEELGIREGHLHEVLAAVTGRGGLP